MAVPTFCAVCDRTVYVAEDQDFACPVCSSPLPEPAQVLERRPSQFSEYYIG